LVYSQEKLCWIKIEQRQCGWMADGVECRNDSMRVEHVRVDGRRATVAVCADHSPMLDACPEKEQGSRRA